LNLLDVCAHLKRCLVPPACRNIFEALQGFPLPMTAAKPWGAPSSQECFAGLTCGGICALLFSCKEDLRRMQLAHQKEHEEQMRRIDVRVLFLPA
jgi:hypothetical protein